MNILKRIENYYYRAVTSLVGMWWNRFNHRSNLHCDVLMFHHVTDGFVDATPSCRRTCSEFRDTLQKRIDAGVKYINMDKLEDLVYNCGKGNYATVTFDDVPYNFLTNAYPILKELQIPFTLFITVSYLEKPGYINKEDLLKIISDPLCTIGAHTLTHPMLRKVKNSFEEILESKSILEGIIKQDVKYLAYPFGKPSSISYKVIKQAEKAGFKLAFSTILTPINDYVLKYKYFLPRVLD